jgi:predicted alpha-1,6-mannanase (GH76 family)
MLKKASRGSGKMKRTELFKRLFFFACFVFYFQSSATTPEQADSAIKAFNSVFWNASNKTFYAQDDKTGLLSFWMSAHAWETEMDAYERTRDTSYLRFVKDAYTGFIATYSTTWSGNQYNDDIMWWCLACTRAYKLTGDTTYRSVAKKNFDWVLSTQYDTVMGGGIWWLNTSHNQKNSCINFPAVCCAVNLYRILSDSTYLNKAVAIYKWGRSKLWASGRVYDNVNVNGSRSTYTSTYNQGTFIGGAFGLFQETKDSAYFRDAISTADYTKNSMCSGGILPDESTTGDIAQFKTVFVNHMMRFIIDGKQSQYLSWMTTNADAVWKNKRSADKIMWSRWNTAAPSSGIVTQGASGGVALMNLLAIANSPTGIICPHETKPVLSRSFQRSNPTRQAVQVNGRVLSGKSTAWGMQAMLQSQDGEGKTSIIRRGEKQ